MTKFRERLKGAENFYCEYLRDELVDDHRAALYHTHEGSTTGTNDSYLWVEISSGLILRSESEIRTAGGIFFISVLHTFDNVTVP
jgi:hypothetical protein